MLNTSIVATLRNGALGLALSAGVGSAAIAASVSDDYSSFWVLGDSLSDTGNLAAATGGAFPGPNYFENRFTNGPVWADYISKRFERAGKAAGNVAFGGATAVANTDPIPDLEVQTGLFRAASAGLAGLRPLVGIWIGGNDIGNTAGTGTAVAAATAAADTIAAQAIGLLDVATDFLIFNMPDVGATPRFQFGDPAAATEATQASNQFNVDILDAVMDIQNAGGEVTLVDVTDLDQLILDAGIINRTTPCLLNDVLLCTQDQAARTEYWDPFHPTAVVHRLAGEEALRAFGTVPVPASAPLLLAGIAIFGLIRRRQRA